MSTATDTGEVLPALVDVLRALKASLDAIEVSLGGEPRPAPSDRGALLLLRRPGEKGDK